MSNEKLEHYELRLDQCPDELVALIAASLSLEEKGSLACTNKRIQGSIYKIFTSFISPDTNKPLTHQQASNRYLRVLEINELLESYKPSRLSTYFNAVKLEAPSSRCSTISWVSGHLSLLAGLISCCYAGNYDTGISDAMSELPIFGTKITVAIFAAAALSIIYRDRETIHFNELNWGHLVDVTLFGYFLFHTMVVAWGPAVFAYWCGATITQIEFISVISAIITVLPAVTSDTLARAVGIYYSWGSNCGFVSGVVSTLPLSIVGLIKGNTWKKIGEGLSAASVTSALAGGVAGLGLLTVDYCGHRFFQQREATKNNLLEEKNKLSSTLELEI